ncbi:MAG: O-antigen ligase family protein [Burkholderiaceae bacterium]
MNSLLKIFLPICLSIPIVIFTIADIEIPLSDIVLIVGLIFFLLNSNTKSAAFLYLVTIFAFISVLAIQISGAASQGLMPYLSVLFFLKPLLGYFAAKGIIKKPTDYTDVVRIISFFMSTSFLLIFVDVIVNYSGVPRADSSMNGSLLGIPQYASYGVNSAACYYFLMFAVIFYSYVTLSENRWMKLFKIISLLSGTYLLFGSLSREAILAYLFFVLLFILNKKTKIKYGVLVAMPIVFAILIYFIPNDLIDSSFLDAKINQIIDGFSQRDFNHISSGRFELYEVAFNQFLRNPFFGNGFHGYTLHPDLISFDIEPIGLSPHNHYITTLWKGGIFFFLAYYATIIFFLNKSKVFSQVNNSEKLLSSFYICTFVVIANVWDVLMVANFGATIFFILGILEARVNVERAVYA